MKPKIKNLTLLFLALLAPIIIGLTPMAIAHAATERPIGTTCETGYAPDCLKRGKSSKIMDFILMVIRFLAALVGIVAVIMLIVGGIQYMTANGNPQAVADAKKKITNVLIGVVAFVFLWAFFEWLIPGGIWTSPWKMY